MSQEPKGSKTDRVQTNPTKLVSQPSQRGSHHKMTSTGQTYLVKFADGPGGKKRAKYEIIGIETEPNKSQKDSGDKTMLATSEEQCQTETVNNESSKTVTSHPRSKRQTKVPKKLLDTETTVSDNIYRSTPIKMETSEARKEVTKEVKVLELPHMTISKISKDDLFIEIEINSGLIVGPPELLKEANGKSKYGIKIFKNTNQEEELKSIESSDQDMKFPAAVKDEVLELSLDPVVHKNIDTPSQKKRQISSQMKSSPRKRRKKKPVKAKNISKFSLESENQTKTETGARENDQAVIDNEASVGLDDGVGDDHDQGSELEPQESFKNEMDQHASIETGQSEGTQTEELHIKKKKKEDGEDTKPKRKYTKRSAYNHDNTHYTVVKNEEGLTVHKCKLCGVEIKLRGNMRDHIRTHTGEKPFECESCGRRFANQNNLYKHLACHSSERPYVCEFCGFGFKVKRQLKLHVLRHTSKGTHICHYCARAFFSTTELRTHVNTHLEEKQFECYECGKSFTHRSSLERHKYIHIGGGPHQCHICGAKFIRQSYFRNHLIKQHSIPKENVDSLIPKMHEGRILQRTKDADKIVLQRTKESEKPEEMVENTVTIENIKVPVVTVNDTDGGEPVYIIEETNIAVQHIQTSNDDEIVFYEAVDTDSGVFASFNKSLLPSSGVFDSGQGDLRNNSAVIENIQIISEDNIDNVEHEVVIKEDMEQVQFIVSSIQNDP